MERQEMDVVKKQIKAGEITNAIHDIGVAVESLESLVLGLAGNIPKATPAEQSTPQPDLTSVFGIMRNMPGMLDSVRNKIERIEKTLQEGLM